MLGSSRHCLQVCIYPCFSSLHFIANHDQIAWFVDVADTARLHVAALALYSVSNERIFAFAEPYTWNEILAIMREVYPTRKIAEDIKGLEKSRLQVSTKRGEQLLSDVFGKKGWTTLDETIRKNLSGLEQV